MLWSQPVGRHDEALPMLWSQPVGRHDEALPMLWSQPVGRHDEALPLLWSQPVDWRGNMLRNETKWTKREFPISASRG